jgi:hypothetical protein
MLRALRAANSEVHRTIAWYDDQRAGLGDEFLQELKLAFERIEAAPDRFGRVLSSPTKDDIRGCRLKRFPYLVYYRLRSEGVLVIAISHTSRKPFYWLNRLR